MKDVLKALQGSRLIAEGVEKDGRKVRHYLLLNGKVLEIVG